MIVKMKKVLAVAVSVSFIASSLSADEGNVITKVGKEVVATTADVGKTVGKGAKKVGAEALDAGKAVGKGVKKVGAEALDAGKVVGKGVKKVGEETLDAGKAVGKGAQRVGEEALELARKATDLFFDPIVVSATRLPSVKTRLSDAPANTSVITREKINGTGAGNIQEALQYLEGVHVYDSVGNGVDSAISLRGFTNNEELAVIIDGVRVNETDLNVFNPNLVNLDTVDTIELQRGSSSTSVWGQCFWRYREYYDPATVG